MKFVSALTRAAVSGSTQARHRRGPIRCTPPASSVRSSVSERATRRPPFESESSRWPILYGDSASAVQRAEAACGLAGLVGLALPSIAGRCVVAPSLPGWNPGLVATRDSAATCGLLFPHLTPLAQSVRLHTNWFGCRTSLASPVAMQRRHLLHPLCRKIERRQDTWREGHVHIPATDLQRSRQHSGFRVPEAQRGARRCCATHLSTVWGRLALREDVTLP